MSAIDNVFYVSFASRVIIYAMPHSQLVLGYGGMISFGHAAFVGAAPTREHLHRRGVTSAWLGWPAAIGASALAAWLIGAVSLRTRGVYFIMITLAFAQWRLPVNSMRRTAATKA